MVAYVACDLYKYSSNKLFKIQVAGLDARMKETFHRYLMCLKVLSTETIPSSVAFVDPNLRNLAEEVAVKVKHIGKVDSNCSCLYSSRLFLKFLLEISVASLYHKRETLILHWYFLC